MKSTFILLSLIALCFGIPRNDSKGRSSAVTLYSGTDEIGSSFRATDYYPHLSDVNFDNKARSGCYTGIWLLYVDTNYRGQNGVAFGYGDDNQCFNINSNVAGKISSIRYSGDMNGIEYETLNVYQEENFSGAEDYFYGDNSNLIFKDVNSIIVTGCSSWTVYANNNYGGDYICLTPKSDCKPIVFPNQSTFNNMKSIGSIRKGCQGRSMLSVSGEAIDINKIYM